MARIKLELPSQFVFSTAISIRITDLNYGAHMGNEVILQIAHEARVQFLARMGYTESDSEGRGIIMSDAAIMYRGEAFHGDIIEVQMAVYDFTRKGCDFYYLMKRKGTDQEIARVKTGIVFFEYASRKTVSVPGRFKEKIENGLA